MSRVRHCHVKPLNQKTTKRTTLMALRIAGWIAALLQIVSSDRTVQYRLSTYPAKPTDPTCHHRNNARLCDPDAILSESIIFPLEDTLETRNVTLSAGNDVVPVQYGVAVMKNVSGGCYSLHDSELTIAASQQMDLTTRGVEDAMDMFYSEPEKAAEVFGRHIHNTWGVGSGAGTGVLIFLSVNDRTVYFSRGKALERVLRDRRIDAVIELMKPFLREQQYDQAILLAISELDKYLQAGEKLSTIDWFEMKIERLLSWFGNNIVFIVLILLGCVLGKEYSNRREYARVASQLSELDRARSEVLQGHFKATSCPICLENFVKIENDVPEGEETPERLIGSNDEPAGEETPERLIGSDGLELKLLRCGHAFDETCWLEWVNNGHHRNIDKCPICQQDVGISSEQPSSATVSLLSIPRGGHNGSDDVVVRDNNNNEEYEAMRNLAMRRYTQDRNFRLIRLAARYPQYIQRNQLQRWTEVSYNGSMANDASLARQAAIDESVKRFDSSSSSSSSGFLGGSSSGGRGGRW